MSQVERQDRNPARAPDTAVACVAGWDAAAVLFFQSVQKSLPAGYGASDRGIHPTYRGTAKLHLDPICSLFRVTAMARTSEGLEWSWVIEILTPDLATTTLILAKEKLTTVLHELHHVSPAFDGDIRRFPGRCYAHSHSQAQYDAEMATLADRYLEHGPPGWVDGFLNSRFADLQARHGAVVGLKLPIPKLIPVG